jgi:predicted nucleic acid-binding protein
MYLLDTNVISEARAPRPDPGVVEWLRSTPPADVYFSAVTFGELERGVQNLAPKAPERARAVSEWIDALARDSQVLPATHEIFRIWRRLMNKRQPHLSNDALIAATALHHDLTVATRNVRDFTAFGVLVANPFGRAR